MDDATTASQLPQTALSQPPKPPPETVHLGSSAPSTNGIVENAVTGITTGSSPGNHLRDRDVVSGSVGAAGGSSMRGLNDPVTCGGCAATFQGLQAYMEHQCQGSKLAGSKPESDFSEGDDSDGENFEGEIVYEPDGSAYIIEHPSPPETPNSSASSPFGSSSVPPLGGYRVYTLRKEGEVNSTELESKDGEGSNSTTEAKATLKKIVRKVAVGREHDSLSVSPRDAANKPILMCFLCKLSFGFTKSFRSHATGEHKMALNEEEEQLLSKKDTSAIIQGVGKSKGPPLLSFLEPMGQPENSDSCHDNASTGSPTPTNSQPLFLFGGALPGVSLSSTSNNLTKVSYVYTSSLLTLPSVGDVYQCRLCNYSTQLKANFQLHCKTDKHTQKLQLVAHIKEGGKQNEWRLNGP
ncbi:Zinc finger homeobox protein 3 [Branchiostoma belcheri]|nr:Zinc finger homeobox protein 3 [Branchiostoma belcheri]